MMVDAEDLGRKIVYKNKSNEGKFLKEQMINKTSKEVKWDSEDSDEEHDLSDYATMLDAEDEDSEGEYEEWEDWDSQEEEDQEEWKKELGKLSTIE